MRTLFSLAVLLFLTTLPAAAQVESEVERLLEPVERVNYPYPGTAAELLTLGEEALPILVERLPRLSTAGVVVAAEVLGTERYRPAASALQAVLERGLTPIPDKHFRDRPNEIDVLRALGRVGGDAQVESVGRYLDDLSADRRFVIREALLALGEIGSQAAAAQVERRLGRSWPPWTTHVTVPDDPGTDTDGDGASDAVERLLGLDPQKADMDGDGIADGADPSPNATDGKAHGEEEEILRTIVESYLLSGDMYYDPKVVVVLADSAVEMRHPRGGVILTMDEEGFAAYQELLGNPWAVGLRVERGEVASRPFADVWRDKTVPARLAELEADERLYVLTKLRLEGILVVVRRTGEGWLVRTLDTWWMS